MKKVLTSFVLFALAIMAHNLPAKAKDECAAEKIQNNAAAQGICGKTCVLLHKQFSKSWACGKTDICPSSGCVCNCE